jgi:vacuolar-type H+-ATPase subunit H
MGKETADEAEKHYDKAKTALEDWLEDAGKKIPVGGVEFSKMVKEVSEASNKAFKEGRRTIDHALEAADKQLEEISEKTKVAAKKATAKKAAATQTTSTATKKSVGK